MQVIPSVVYVTEGTDFEGNEGVLYWDTTNHRYVVWDGTQMCTFTLTPIV
jgi:hypothetical protein